MALMRALTVFTSISKWNKDVIYSRVSESLDLFRDFVKKFNFWTFRVVVPPIPRNMEIESYIKIVHDILSSFPKDILMQLIPVEIYDAKLITKILDTIDDYPNLYATIKCSTIKHLDSITSALIEYKGDVNTFTKFSITIGSWIQTPYFPSTSNYMNVNGFSIALRYVDLVYEAIVRSRYEKLREFIDYVLRVSNIIEENTKYEFLGLDLSISPWMGESVAKLVEDIIKAPFGTPGTLTTLKTLNDFIIRIAREWNVKTIGFNEVMLPVAEDNTLRLRVRERLLRLGDLINYSLICVAGLDLVALNRDEKLISKTLGDMYTVYEVKGKTIGVRIIPVDMDYVETRFGPLHRIEI